MKHPSETQLALFAGGDLAGYWQRWAVGRHVAQCGECQVEVSGLRETSGEVRSVVADLPKDLNWNRLADDMTGNIRVGLAAGKPLRVSTGRWAVRICGWDGMRGWCWLALPRCFWSRFG